jgi:hypothetical protein
MTTATARTERTSRQPTRAAVRRRALRASTVTTSPSSPPAASTTASATAARARTSTGAGYSCRESIRIGRTSWDSTCLPVRTTADGGLTFRGFHWFLPVVRIRIHRIHVFLGLPSGSGSISQRYGSRSRSCSGSGSGSFYQ